MWFLSPSLLVSLPPFLSPSLSQALPFLHQAVVSEPKIQSLAVQELDWGDAALLGIMDGTKPQQIPEAALRLLCLAVMLTMTDTEGCRP